MSTRLGSNVLAVADRQLFSALLSIRHCFSFVWKDSLLLLINYPTFGGSAWLLTTIKHPPTHTRTETRTRCKRIFFSDSHGRPTTEQNGWKKQWCKEEEDDDHHRYCVSAVCTIGSACTVHFRFNDKRFGFNLHPTTWCLRSFVVGRPHWRHK